MGKQFSGSVLAFFFVVCHFECHGQVTFRGQLVWPPDATISQKLRSGLSNRNSNRKGNSNIATNTNGVRGVVVYLSRFSDSRPIPSITPKSAMVDYEDEFERLNGYTFDRLKAAATMNPALQLPGFPIEVGDLEIPARTSAILAGVPLVFVNTSKKRHLFFVGHKNILLWCDLGPRETRSWELEIAGSTTGQRAVVADSLNGAIAARLLVFNHRYFAVSDNEGKFEIADIPIEEKSFLWNLYNYRTHIDPSTGKATKRRIGRREEIHSAREIDVGRIVIRAQKQ